MPTPRAPLSDPSVAESLRNAEAALRVQSAALAAAANAIVITDRDGTIVWVNPAFATLTGYALADAFGKNPRDLVKSGKMDPAAYKDLWETILAGRVWRGELINRRKDGSLYPEEQTITPVRASGGEITHFIAVKQDLTERKQAEAALRESEQLLADAQALANMGSYVLDISSGHWRSSAALDALLGIDQAYDRSVEGWKALVHPDDRAMMADYFSRDVLGRGQTFNKEYRIIRHDNRAERWVQGFGKLEFDAQGRPVVMQGAIQDITERKRAVDALRQAEAKFHAIFDYAMEGIFQTTPEGKFLSANPAMARILGYGSAEELIAHVGTAGGAEQVYVDPARRGQFQRALERGGVVEAFESEVVCKDGRRKWVSENARAVRDADGRVLYYEGSFEDISARRQAETALRTSEERYRLLFEHAPDAIFTLAPTGAILSLNQAFDTITGWPPAEWLGQPFQALIHPDDQASAAELLQVVLRDRRATTFELRMRTAAGGFRNVEFTGFHNQLSGGRIEVQGIGRDVTERKLAQTALQQSEERYRLLFENNPLPMWLYDLKTLRFLAVNESAVQSYGFTRAEFLAMTIKQIRPEEDIARLLKFIAKIKGENRSASEWRHRRKDGSIIQVEVISRPLVFAGRKARLVLAADITEKKLLEDKFLHAQRLESLGMLAAGIAHDLNNVLAPIMFAAPLLRDSLSTPRDLKILDTVEQSAGRGAGLVKQILGFAHSATGEFRPTQVKHLLKDIINVIEETFPKSIQLEQQIPSDLWLVQGNATQIHQVLLNLCVNARDAMPSGGTLRIVAANRRLDTAAASTIRDAQPGDWLMLEVADTGTGIAPEVLERIWTPFFTTKGAGKGTGLGLSTIRGIVLSHHGFIELDTKVGCGTTLRAFLPAVERESSRSISASPFGTPDGHGELILVVEDDPAIRDMVSEILGQHGYRVMTCADGMEAISLIYASPGEFSIVITDADMPHLDGVVLVRSLLQLRPDIRLLAMSGLSRREDGGSGLAEIQNLAHAFLPKPLTPAELLRAVHALLHPPSTA